MWYTIILSLAMQTRTEINEQSERNCQGQVKPIVLQTPTAAGLVSRQMAIIISENIFFGNQPYFSKIANSTIELLQRVQGMETTTTLVTDFQGQVFWQLKMQAMKFKISQSTHRTLFKFYRLFCSSFTVKLTKRKIKNGLTILKKYSQATNLTPNQNRYFGRPVASCHQILHAYELKFALNFYVRFAEACTF